MAQLQLRGGRLCARLELRHAWPARCSSSGGRPSLIIALRAWPHAQLAGRPLSAARRLALRTIAAWTLPPRVSLAICSVGGNAGVLERGRPARDFGGKVDKRSTGESHMVIQ
jgi:hypothetical protein